MNSMIIVPFPDIGDGFAYRAGERVVVSHFIVDVSEICRFALANRLVDADGNFWVYFDRNLEVFEYGGGRMLAPPLRMKLRVPSPLPGSHHHIERRRIRGLYEFEKN